LLGHEPQASAFAAPVAAGTFEEAFDANARGDYAKALRLIRPLANDGDAAAQFNLGLMYMTGHGVQQDYAAAALWYRKAAEQGYGLAQSNLGFLYRDGRGVTRSRPIVVICIVDGSHFARERLMAFTSWHQMP
jgi:TPR repeat protein